MTRPEADDLFREYARSRDHAVMARLVEENLPLSQAVARKFQGQGVEKDDLEQVAAMALMQAIERFDPERGLQFSTFALPTIAGSVRNYLRDRGGTIRLTRSLREQLTKLRRVSDELTRKLQREPSMRELAEAMELPPEELLTLLDALPLTTLLPASYLLFGLMWGVTVFLPMPLTAYYSMNGYGGETALQNPLFMRTNRILTACWAVLYLLTPIWTWYLLQTPVSYLTGALNSVLPMLLGAFTAWFQRWYPAHYAASKK